MLIRKITPGIIPNTGDSRRPDIRLIADLVPIHRLRDAEEGTADTQAAVRLELTHHISPDSARRIIDFAVIPPQFGGIKFQPLHNQYPVTWYIAQGPVRILLVKAQIAAAVKAVADPQDLRRKCAVSLSEYERAPKERQPHSRKTQPDISDCRSIILSSSQIYSSDCKYKKLSLILRRFLVKEAQVTQY